MSTFNIRSFASNVIGGPSKWDLMLALFDRKPDPRTVEFKLDDRVSVVAIVDGVEAEDGSGESWTVTGQVRRMNPSVERDNRLPARKFKAYYNTLSRKGHIELLD